MLEKSLEPEFMEKARARFRRLLSEKHFSINREMVDRAVAGAVDLFVHAWPDAYVARPHSEIDVGRRATDAGMRAVVFKCHSTPSAGRAPLVQEAVDEYAAREGKTPAQIIGGVVLNHCVGGINPYAVEACAKFGGRFVWLPSVHASHHFQVLGKHGGIPVLDGNKKPLPAVMDVLKIIADQDMVLALAHQSTEERFIITKAAKELGVRRICADHPQGLINKMTVEQMAELADLGVVILIQSQSIFRHELNDETMEMIAKIPAERLAYGSDLSQWGAVHPVDGVRMIVEVLLKFGVGEDLLRKIFAENPTRLVFE